MITAEEQLSLLRTALRTLDAGTRLDLFWRNRGGQLEFAAALKKKPVCFPDGVGWIWVDLPHKQKLILKEAIVKLCRLIQRRKQCESDRKRARIRNASAANSRVVDVAAYAKTHGGILFSADWDRQFVYIGGLAGPPVQNDKSANLPSE